MFSIYCVVSVACNFSLEFTTQDTVTPSFTVTSALRDPDQLGSLVYAHVVGAEIYWTIDVPSKKGLIGNPWVASSNRNLATTFVEIDTEIIFPLTMVREGQLLMTGGSMCTILVNRRCSGLSRNSE